jgi:hypothetical protein
MPNGSRSFPARSCCDLKEQYPEMPSGLYWIDPNGGCSADGFQVHCDYEDGSCATCIDANEWSNSLETADLSEKTYQSISTAFDKQVLVSAMLSDVVITSLKNPHSSSTTSTKFN